MVAFNADPITLHNWDGWKRCHLGAEEVYYCQMRILDGFYVGSCNGKPGDYLMMDSRGQKFIFTETEFRSLVKEGDDMERTAPGEVRQQRQSIYGDPKITMDLIAQHWTALVRAHTGANIEIPPHLVALMMVALKLHRAATPLQKIDSDSYIDAHVYLDFALEMDPLLPLPAGK